VNGYGEFKPSKNFASADVTIDLYRICVFGKTGIEENKTNSLLTFRSVGCRIIFYVITNVKGIFYMIYLFDIMVPTTVSSFDTLCQSFKALYNLRRIYKKFCCVDSLVGVSKPRYFTPTLNWQIVENFSSKSISNCTK
jgi:hypothetical protein